MKNVLGQEVYYIFLSTLSLRRATLKLGKFEVVIMISIHALLAESDSLRHDIHEALTDFYPRSPCGERLLPRVLRRFTLCHFYPRSPCGERPLKLGKFEVVIMISIHALLAESDCSGFA